jgi:homoserine dehydrogenase
LSRKQQKNTDGSTPIQTTKRTTPTMQAVKIGLAGFGTVGGGTYAVLKRNAAELARRAGAPIEVKSVVCRNIDRARGLVEERVLLTKNWKDLVEDPEIDIVVEVMGGIEPAKSLVLEAIAAGKHVVTANKALLALHGNEIFSAAAEKGVAVSYEAAVAGGIPIIKSLREGLAANRIEWIAGIINGTCNFILSTMRDKGLSFDEALSQAKDLGYAEADPTFDIEGIDAAHKITLLSALAFGTPVNFEAAHVEGITKLSSVDIRYAENLGYRIKLLGVTRRTETGIELRVHPALVPMRRLLANVEGVMNAVVVKGDAVGSTLFYGRGAGSEPTASAVVADIVDIVRMTAAGDAQALKPAAYNEETIALGWLPMSETVSSYYMRIPVADEPGVLAQVARVFSEKVISIEAVMQPEAAIGRKDTEIVVMTHSAVEGAVLDAIAAIEALPTTRGKVVMIRKEELN